jgi:hypothetical protein
MLSLLINEFPQLGIQMIIYSVSQVSFSIQEIGYSKSHQNTHENDAKIPIV